MRRLALMVGVSAVIVGALTGCSSSSGPSVTINDSNFYSEVVQLPNGKTVICVGDIDGGMTCDWDHVSDH